MKVVGAALVFLSLVCWANGFNITQILNGFSDYSQFNRLLSDTKLADEINSRQTITVLVVSNANMGSLSGMPLAAVKKALSLHVVLDFFDRQKLLNITNGSTLSTTLYQTTGNAPGNTGFLNITDINGGKVAFGLAAKGSKLDSTFVKSVKQEGYNISVIEVSQSIATATNVAQAPAPSPAHLNITALLIKKGYKNFTGLLSSTGALKIYEDAVEAGLTIFAPTDAALSGFMKKVSNLASDNKVSLLLFHALPTYSPLGTLKTTNGPIGTLATSGGNKYAMTVSTSGDTVILNTGVNKANISSTVVDEQPLAIYAVSKVLEPTELFSVAPASEPAFAPEADSPSTSVPPRGAARSTAPSAESDSPSGSAKAHDSMGVGRSVRAWALILSVAAFAAVVMF